MFFQHSDAEMSEERPVSILKLESVPENLHRSESRCTIAADPDDDNRGTSERPKNEIRFTVQNLYLHAVQQFENENDVLSGSLRTERDRSLSELPDVQ